MSTASPAPAETSSSTQPSASAAAAPGLKALVEQTLAMEAKIREGGGAKAVERQHEKGRLTARERVELLVDKAVGSESRPAQFLELGLWAAWGMYKEFGGAPAAGVVTGIGQVSGRTCMIIANDATVKAGAFFPMTCKKIIRAQTIAQMARMPLIYLVDSAGVFLPLQEDVFPDTDDFGRVFRNNAVISAEGIPQIAAIMGYCVAGGGYLPVLCDTLLMTEGSGLYLAGPALVKAAIGQEVSDEELGGAKMHGQISGTIDFREPDDEACIRRLRALISDYPPVRVMSELKRLGALVGNVYWEGAGLRDGMHQLRMLAQEKDERNEPTAAAVRAQAQLEDLRRKWDHIHSFEGLRELYEAIGGVPPTQGHAVHHAFRQPEDVYAVFSDKPGAQYDMEAIIACIVDARSEKNAEGFESLAPDFDEYKAEYGQSIVCGYAKIGGHACGIVANQKKLVQRTVGGGKAGPHKATQMPGVIYDDSADKAARFILDCNQRKIPLIFLHDTTGFMVGRDSEQGGIIRAGAKMVNAVSNSVVPKISVILGGSYGAGHYAMCGRAFDPFLTFAWPSARYAVMGANQATGTLAQIEEAARRRRGEEIDEETHKQILAAIHAGYTEQQDIRHGAARGWVDRIIEPHRTREELIAGLEAAANWDYSRPFRTGVLQT